MYKGQYMVRVHRTAFVPGAQAIHWVRALQERKLLPFDVKSFPRFRGMPPFFSGESPCDAIRVNPLPLIHISEPTRQAEI